MHSVIETSNQIVFGSMFGSTYVSERHADETHCYLLPSDNDDIGVRGFNQALKALRAALSLR